MNNQVHVNVDVIEDTREGQAQRAFRFCLLPFFISCVCNSEPEDIISYKCIHVYFVYRILGSWSVAIQFLFWYNLDCHYRYINVYYRFFHRVSAHCVFYMHMKILLVVTLYCMTLNFLQWNLYMLNTIGTALPH